MDGSTTAGSEGDGSCKLKTVSFVGQMHPPTAQIRRQAAPTTTAASPSAAGGTPNGLGLVHDTADGGCPGFTGGGAKMAVRPRTLRQLLLDDARQIVIPLFQRKYCWTRQQGEKWFADLRRGVKKNGWNGCHNTGKAIFKPQRAEGNGSDRTLICVDGQQRITTTSILLMALRDNAAKVASPPDWVVAFKAQVDRLLWSGSQEDDATTLNGSGTFEDTKEGTTASRDVDSWRLVPSYADRGTYRTLLLQCSHAPSHNGVDVPSAPLNECILHMYTLMDDCVSKDVELFGCRILETILAQAVDEMYVVSVEIESDPDLAHVFLWLQEKSLLGMGSILENLAPGVAFHAGDLIRNLLLAPFMRQHGLDSSALEQVHRKLWLEPIERPAGSLPRLDAMIDDAMCRWYHAQWRRSSVGEPVASPSSSALSNAPLPQRSTTTDAVKPTRFWHASRTSVSPFERRIVQTVEFLFSRGVLQYATEGIELYGRFITFVDDLYAAERINAEDGHLPPTDVAVRILSLLGGQCD